MTHILDQLKKAWELIFKPEKSGKLSLDLVGALRFYYLYSIIPVILAIIVGALVGTAVGSGIQSGMRYSLPMGIGGVVHSVTAAASAVLPAFISGYTLLWFWIFVPIGIFINAAIYQLIGKYLLNAWNGKYEKTFTAAMLAVIPSTLFYFLAFLPGINLIYLIVTPIWGMVILIIALAALQKTTRVVSLVSLLTTWLAVALVLTLLVGVAILGSVSALGLYRFVF
ncbi:MAG: hypothetical protein KGH98_03645 [Candidatus Micrarchaeota archaeon]|nr:hypothetical protein [Candidatus Micrarchaeota archaeon]